MDNIDMFVKEELELRYLQIIDMWKHFCELHNTLYELCLDEYQALLSSDVDTVAKCVASKELIIKDISRIEALRIELIDALNENLSSEHKIVNVQGLIEFFNFYEKQKSENLLEKYNSLLASIITSIQGQNKKNQLFINKALYALKEIRETTTGVKTYNQYNSQGQTSTRVK